MLIEVQNMKADYKIAAYILFPQSKCDAGAALSQYAYVLFIRLFYLLINVIMPPLSRPI